MPTAGLEPTPILVKHELVEKLQMRPLIGKGLKYQFAIDPVSYFTKSLVKQ